MDSITWMKAAVYYGPGDVRIERVPAPPWPGPDEVCVRVLTASLCGTDASQYQTASMIPLEHPHAESGYQAPLILGHEVCGEVIARGERVRHLAIGDRVAVGAGMWCGTCSRCLEGRPNICERAFVYGLHAPGGLAERALFPAKMCVRVPASCSSEAAALAQPLAVALHALTRGQITEDMTIAIFGIGGIGSLLLAALCTQKHLRPSLLVAIDIDPIHLERARKLGADVTVNALEDDSVQIIHSLTEGRGVDRAIEMSGQENSVTQALQATRRGGKILQVGIPRVPVVLPIGSQVVEEKDLITTNGHICQVDLPVALEMLATTDLAERVGIRAISLDELVTEGLIPLVEHRSSRKVVVMMD